MNEYRIIIAGGRDFNNYDALKEHVDRCINNVREQYGMIEIVIVSGRAKGTDILGERYAREKGYKVKEFSADWQKNKKAAGPIRNKQMAEYADALIAFWDGKSKGTKNMIEQARNKNLYIYPIYKY